MADNDTPEHPAPGTPLPPPQAHTPPAVQQGSSAPWTPPRIAGALSGAAMVIGAFLPWVTVRAGILQASVNGIEGDGQITASIGIGLAVTGLAAVGVLICAFTTRDQIPEKAE